MICRWNVMLEQQSFMDCIVTVLWMVYDKNKVYDTETDIIPARQNPKLLKDCSSQYIERRIQEIINEDP